MGESFGEGDEDPGGVCPPVWMGSFLRQRILQANNHEASSHVEAFLDIGWKF